MSWHVAIAGGGFGGLYAARRLEHVLPKESARITLVSDTNFLLYTPLLPGAASGTLEPRHVVVPLRQELHHTSIRLGWVTGADPTVNELRYRTADERDESLRYDQLIVALGSVSRVLPIPGLAEHGLGFKTISEAIALRNRVLVSLELAEAADDPQLRREYLTFAFVGAGYAGVEGIAELQDFVADVIDRYPRSRLEGTRWILVEAQDRIMMEIAPSLAEFAMRDLRGRGIEVRTGTRLDAVEESAVVLSTGERIPCRTVCWTAGVKPPALVRDLGLPLTHEGRIDVDENMRVRGRENVWAIGDSAAVPDPAKSRTQPSPPTAQHALRQGKRVAENVAATLGHGHIRPFTYKTLGVFVDMGRHKAVAEVLGVRLRGFPAWWAARTYHLAAMPGVGRRLRLLVDWTVALLFQRDSAELGQLGHPPSLRGYLETPSPEPKEGETAVREAGSGS
ncbi:MAG TPA: NAD(P)/FAD-dependent oxidoreductase [Thermoleophilaceae bacterium]